ncbi:hypothetical protein D3C72_1252860 [compost metagenome]
MALVVLHVVVVQPAGVVAVRPLDLGNHLVAAAFEGEAVDFRLAQQGRQGAAQGVHRHPHLRRLGPVDIHHHLGLVEGQVDVEEGELAGFLGAGLDALGHIQQCRVVASAVDDELEWQALAGAGQRRQVEAEDLQATDFLELALHQWQQLHLRALALVPGLEQEAADAGLHAIETVDLERRVILGESLEQRGEFVGIGVEVIKVGRLRRTAHHEDHPLVLVGRQFVLGELQQYRNQAQDDHGKHQYHRPAVEGGVQQALVAHLQAFEQHVQAVGQAAWVLLLAQQQRAHHR